MRIIEDFQLKGQNTFGLDIKAKYYAEISKIDEIKELYSSYSSSPIMILGGGSNILFSKDYDGLMIKNLIKGIKKVYENEDIVLIEAGAGEVWEDFVQYTVDNNWGGLENLSLIPGTVGASPIQNIGAYGTEIKDVFEELKGYNLETGEVSAFSLAQCRFGYRDSVFKRELKGKFVVTSVTYRLCKNPQIDIKYEALRSELEKLGIESPTVKQVSEIVCNIRRSKLPDPKIVGNAGSFFKNPEISDSHYQKLLSLHNDIPGYKTGNNTIKVPAGWLIQKCGWRGKRLGNVGVYDKQALVLVNYGGADGNEIIKLSENIKESVKKEFDIWLETEVNIV
ncbi:MAG: UDP-N-acetylmuramate dehydrogenase [Bacteroidota bacterium]|nr:UDP-N-acetylmuramate dehydrogenase [Bacteroidota bacterium]MDP4192872.1 UDP-N-acetylmuramate dehydrogenase [Bacteroidota bacterium]MDP4193574.1 UDP-N-acetylmuramate dehydrogenase [Bacteroidota bacterium]